MINRSQYKKLCAMTPGAQWWEKRYIAFNAGAYHLNNGRGCGVTETLELIEYAIQKHREQDEREAAAAPLMHVDKAFTG